MPVRPLIDFQGAIDIHVHSSPSYTHIRPYDDDVTARQGVELGMAAIVLKDHTESTVTRAYLAQKAAPGIRMFGGVVLNHALGGINPDAADFACTMGAAQVWMPTVDAARHAEVFAPGGYGQEGSDLGPAEIPKKSRHLLRTKPIHILRDDGELIQAAKDVIKICQVWDVMVGTSHLYKNEVFALAKFAKQEGFKKLVVTHVNWAVVCNYTDEEMKNLAELGAWLEFCGTALYPPAPDPRTEHDEVKLLSYLGSKQCILASDAGAQVFGTAPSVFRGYLQILLNAGLPLKDIRLMAFDRPREMLKMN